MSTLLVVQSYAGAKEQVGWSAPYWRTPGWDIVGTCPINSQHSWPEDFASVPMGMNGYMDENMMRRWVGVWETLACADRFKDYSDFCVIEYDSIFLRKPPEYSGGLVTRLAGGPVHGAKAKQFFHCPWWVSRDIAKEIAKEGNRIMAQNHWELYSPDFMLGRIVDNLGIPWTDAHVWSCNGNDLQNRRDQAEEAIRKGVWYLHGLKTKAELDWILSIKPCTLLAH